MLRQFLNAITKIFDLPAWFKTIPSTGTDTGYSRRGVAALVLVGALLKMRSLEQVERWSRRGRFKRFGLGPISADTIRRKLTKIPPVVWHELIRQVGRKLARNRAWTRIDGWRVVALDGVELFVQHSVDCSECLHRTINGATEWFHRLVVASTVGPRRQAVLEWESVHPADGSAKNEGESTAAYRLLATLYRHYHHQIEIVVADALYCNRVFLQQVLDYGWNAVVRLKDERLTILQDAKGLLKQARPVVTRQLGHERLELWDVPGLSWGPMEHLRVIYWTRTVTQRRRGPKHRDHTDTKVFHGWALTTCGPAVAAETVWLIMHHRWDLENCIFRQGKNTWKLAHCFGHDPAIIEALVGAQLVALTWWIWWSTQDILSPALAQAPRLDLLERAREGLGTLRTRYQERWCLQST